MRSRTEDRSEIQPFGGKSFLAAAGPDCVVRGLNKRGVAFAQGDPADSVFYVVHGTIRLTIVSPHGSQAVIALLGAGTFFGEACLAGQTTRPATALAMTACSVIEVERRAMARMLREHRDVSEAFIAHLLARNIRVEEDVVDHHFNSSEKRLARTLLLLATDANAVRPAIADISQETLAEMVGTTRSRISFFLTKFHKAGFIDYEHGMQVHATALHSMLHESRHGLERREGGDRRRGGRSALDAAKT